MIKTTLITIIISLFLFSSASARSDCSGYYISVYGSSGERFTCIPFGYDEGDPLWWLNPDLLPKPDPDDPDPPGPGPWKEILRSRLEEIIGQSEVSDIIKDIEVLAAINVLVGNLPLDLQKSFHSTINSTAEEILPDEIDVKFPHH